MPDEGIGAAKRVGCTALACAVVGFGLTLVAEVMPWMTVHLSGVRDPVSGEPLPDQSGNGTDLGLDRLFSWQGMLYNGGWLVLFALLGLALVSEPVRRRAAVAAGIGVAAGQLTLLVGLARAIDDGAGIATEGLVRTGGTPPIVFGPGLYAAFAAVPVLVTALALAGRTRAEAGPEPAREPEVASQPFDLTVTPVPPSR